MLKVTSYLTTKYMYLVETVGRAIPCFRHGTDYILNLKKLSGPPAYYAKYNLYLVR